MVIPQNIQDEILLDVIVLTKQNTQDHLDKVMQDNPRLTSFGFGSYDPKDFERDREELRNDLAGFQAACVYLSRVNKTKSINTVISSYGYKHRVEDMVTCPQKSDPIIKLGSKEKKIWAKSDSQASRSSVNFGK